MQVGSKRILVKFFSLIKFKSLLEYVIGALAESPCGISPDHTKRIVWRCGFLAWTTPANFRTEIELLQKKDKVLHMRPWSRVYIYNLEIKKPAHPSGLN